jgi:type 1 glutamine amidotransferase
VAWVNHRADGGWSFYTSLGHPDDFANPAFRRLLANAIRWTASQPRPEAKPPAAR